MGVFFWYLKIKKMSLDGSLDVAQLHKGDQMQAQKDLQSEHTNYNRV